MKTKFYILAIIVALLYSCQKKENDTDIDPDEISGINDTMLRKWFLLNKESDSIINSAQRIIQQQREEVESHPQDEREYMNTYITKAQQNLDQLKKKVKYTKEFVAHIEHYDSSLQPQLDSLEADYVLEKNKLENALSQLK